MLIGQALSPNKEASAEKYATRIDHLENIGYDSKWL